MPYAREIHRTLDFSVPDENFSVLCELVVIVLLQKFPAKRSNYDNVSVKLLRWEASAHLRAPGSGIRKEISLTTVWKFWDVVTSRMGSPSKALEREKWWNLSWIYAIFYRIVNSLYIPLVMTFSGNYIKSYCSGNLLYLSILRIRILISACLSFNDKTYHYIDWRNNDYISFHSFCSCYMHE